jgi:hypothetical protein
MLIRVLYLLFVYWVQDDDIAMSPFKVAEIVMRNERLHELLEEKGEFVCASMYVCMRASRSVQAILCLMLLLPSTVVVCCCRCGGRCRGSDTCFGEEAHR